APFAIDLAVAPAPWAPDHRLVRIGLKGREIEPEARPATSLVFLVDTSGSMNRPNKLPLVQESLRMLVHALHGDDRIAIVTYAGTSGVALPSTYCMEKERLLDAIHHLRPGGSTNGAAGIQLAYDIAQQHFIEGGVNRVILCTDGDFNVGASSDGELVDLIARKRESGVFLNVLGYGTGNFQDAKMEALSNNGNGMFAYIDSRDEAKRVLVEKMAGTLVTIAKDVKIQVEFNPAQVGAYRLIGYANRLLEARDFNDDRKDAGEIGAGHTVTALYEVIPAGLPLPDGEVDDLEFQKARELVESDAMLLVKLRYKAPDGDVSTLITRSLIDGGGGFEAADADFRLASAAAAFGMVLRESEYRGTASFDSILALLGDAIDDDRAAFARPEMLDDLDRRVVREDEAAPRGADTMEGLAADAVPTSATRREESLEQLKRLVKAARAMTEAREATRDGAGHDRP
ncbi:MAG: vWA domain-containing protein, partial [Planctomycetota bacterium]